MVYGHSSYPGLRGFSVEVDGDNVYLKSLNGTPYDIGHFFKEIEKCEIIKAVKNHNCDFLESVSDRYYNPLFF